MAWAYFGELLRRVFFPTTKGADYVSVLVPLAIAATAFFLGVKVSEDATVQILAYVGLFTLLTFLLRLFVTGPYGMWKERVAEVGELKLELTRPERLELEHIARWRAKARMRLATRIREFAWAIYHDDYDKISALSRRMMKLHARIGEHGAVSVGISRLHDIAKAAEGLDKGSIELRAALKEASRTSGALQDHLHGKITAEVLALQLHQDTEAKTLQ